VRVHTHTRTHLVTCVCTFGCAVALGAVVEVADADELCVLQPLCVREEGSTEWYADSRVEPVAVAADAIVRVMDTFPSQRPIPSLGGGIGYGAEGVDCWELQVSFVACTCGLVVSAYYLYYHIIICSKESSVA